MTQTHITCTRRIEFDMAHRLLNHEGKCKNLHGHHYALEASFTAPQLDALGRVVDFGVVKEKLGAWIDANWDHATVLYEKDKKLGEAITRETGQRIFYLDANPTAENLAGYLFSHICPMLFAKLNIECVAIKLYETPNCYVEAR